MYLDRVTPPWYFVLPQCIPKVLVKNFYPLFMCYSLWALVWDQGAIWQLSNCSTTPKSEFLCGFFVWVGWVSGIGGSRTKSGSRKSCGSALSHLLLLRLSIDVHSSVLLTFESCIYFIISTLKLPWLPNTQDNPRSVNCLQTRTSGDVGMLRHLINAAFVFELCEFCEYAWYLMELTNTSTSLLELLTKTSVFDPNPPPRLMCCPLPATTPFISPQSRRLLVVDTCALSVSKLSIHSVLVLIFRTWIVCILISSTSKSARIATFSEVGWNQHLLAT